MKLYIGNLSYDTTEQELKDALAEHEPILEIHRPEDFETGKPRGFAFVTFGSREAGESAMKALDGTSLGGRQLKVNEAEERRPNPRQAERNPRVSMKIESSRPVDDRPIKANGERVRYKAI